MIKLGIILFILFVSVSCQTGNKNMRNPAYGMGPAIVDAKKLGEDYILLTREALNRRSHSLHRLFVLSAKFGTDSSDCHGFVLSEILRRTGDDFFGTQLMLESPNVRSKVQANLLRDFVFVNRSLTKSDLKRWFPRTFSVNITTE